MSRNGEIASCHLTGKQQMTKGQESIFQGWRSVHGGGQRKPRRQASGRYAEKNEVEEGEGQVAAAEGPHQ